jgi:hypothetical protein
MDSDSLYALASVVVAVFGGAAVLTPIVALSARFALRPVMETWMRLRQSETSDQEKILQDRRIALLEAEIQGIQQLLQQRQELQEFDRDLREQRQVAPGGPGSGA